MITGALAFYAAEVKLPPPYATPSANNRPKVIARPNGAQLRVPAGFDVEVWAEGFDVPRFMVQGPNKELLLSDSAKDGDGTVYLHELSRYASQRVRNISGGKQSTTVERPHGVGSFPIAQPRK